MRGDESSAERAAWARRGGALLFAIACWEVFLRVDSMILAAATKRWLFPLLATALTADGVVLGAALGRVAIAGLGPAGARRLRRIGFPLTVASVAALEYALLAYHHLAGRVDARIPMALAAGGLAWAAAGAARDRGGITGAGARRPAMLPAWAAVLVATLATGVLVRALGRPDVFYGLLRRNNLVGRVLGHGLAAFPPTLPAVAPPSALPPRPARAPLGPASVVLLSIDALRADALGVYGAPPARSPRLDALAGESIVFRDAYTQSPNSAPSMATVFTGLYPFHHGVRNNRVPLRDPRPRLPELLAAAGYATAAFVTNPNFGDPFEFARGFGTYRYERATLGGDGLVRDSNDPAVVDAALAWIRTHGGAPFFVWVHLMAPHSPYIPPPDLRPRARGRGAWFDVWNMQSPEARLEERRTSFDRDVYAALYAAEVASADRLAGRLLDGLAAAGVLDAAHVVVVADHGEAFGESDVFGHGRSLDRAETRVPLLWRLPGARRRGEITTTVQLADVMPTLVDLLGVRADERDGRDLAAVVLGEAADDDGFAFTEGRYLHSMGVRGLLYGGRTRHRTLWLDAGYRSVCAFDRDRDPGERVRHAGTIDGADPFDARLTALARAAQDALAVPIAKVALDPEQRERLRALGYAQ